ncbi:MAG: hypothetical protein E6Q36_02715 [Chryseobacterium sp.]|nr:MAG: hypothetical protein E6Q36_02715 [Chryseobacterium sp.]
MYPNECSTIKEWFGIDLDESQIIYFENISDFSWSASLLIYRKDGFLFCIEDETPEIVCEDEALSRMLDFEETLAMYPKR